MVTFLSKDHVKYTTLLDGCVVHVDVTELDSENPNIQVFASHVTRGIGFSLPSVSRGYIWSAIRSQVAAANFYNKSEIQCSIEEELFNEGEEEITLDYCRKHIHLPKPKRLLKA